MADQYILYGGGIARDVIVRMILAEGDIPYELRMVDIVNGAHRTDEFRQLNPAGYVPALVTPDGQTLFETAAIAIWLLEQHSMTDLLPMPGDPDRGRFLSMLFFHTNEIQPSFKRWYYPHRFTSEGAKGRQKIMNAAREMLLDRWAVLDGMLSSTGPFHLGDRFSVLDMHMAMWAVYGIETSGDILEKFPAVAKVTETAFARPKSGPLLVQQRDDMRRWREATEHMTTTTGTY